MTILVTKQSMQVESQVIFWTCNNKYASLWDYLLLTAFSPPQTFSYSWWRAMFETSFPLLFHHLKRSLDVNIMYLLYISNWFLSISAFFILASMCVYVFMCVCVLLCVSVYVCDHHSSHHHSISNLQVLQLFLGYSQV